MFLYASKQKDNVNYVISEKFKNKCKLQVIIIFWFMYCIFLFLFYLYYYKKVIVIKSIIVYDIQSYFD